MMKKEDLKKHFNEEKTASVTEKVFIVSVFISFLYLSSISAQIPINGFCRYREFAAKINYSKILPIDYNSDGYRDLLIYNQSNNKYATLISDPKSNFGNASEKFSSFSLESIHPFGSGTSEKRFLIASPKTRQVALAAFSKNGMMFSSSKIKFQGFPSTIDVSDIEGDGKPEGLVCGSTLDGLYLLHEKNRTLKETKIIEGKAFSSASFIDLDYDSFVDIAAIDQLSNSIILYYNDKSGNFRELRSIGLYEDVCEFKTSDLNSDGFTDLIYVRGNRFEVLLGDSVSSFQKKIFIDNPVKPDKYSILDFNGDGFNDIAFINIKTGSLYISFAQGTNKFYPPVLYMKKNGLTDISAYIDRAGKKLVVLSSDGKVYLINTIGLEDSLFSITAGNNPIDPHTFDFMNDGFQDFCFIDEGEQSLKLFMSERRNLFRIYFSIPLAVNSSNILVDDFQPKIKTFYCYSKGGRTLEIIKMNFESNKYTKLDLYTDKPIEDMKLSQDRLKDRQTLYILCKEGNDLFLENFEIRNFRTASSAIYPIGSNIDKAWLSFGVYRDIYTLSRYNNKVTLNKIVFDKKIIERKTLLSFDITSNDKLSYNLICFKEALIRFKPAAAIITVNNKSTLYYIINDRVTKYPLKNPAAQNTLLKYSLNENSDEPTIYYNDLKRNKLHGITIQNSNGASADKELIEFNEANNYLVTRLYGIKTFLIYSNILQNTLSFEKL
ncbi:MAG: VCBS repeat-containing protein [Ignavibacteriales bacterium]|nr:VCBS repeat-containing protein [Ignavibacteriales bacterium]